MKKHSPFSKIALSLLFIIGATQGASAQTIAETMPFGMNELLWGITLLMGAVLLFLIFLMLRLVQMLKDEKAGVPKKQRLTMWERLLSLRPMADEEELVMDHTYDGIYELDNPTPPWFNFLFYGTIIIGIIYMVNYHVIGDGRVQENEYQAELDKWEVKVAAYQAEQTDLIDESNVQLITDPAMLADAATIFQSKCVACHGEKAEGKNGPNLTDEYWIHGGELKHIFKTIVQGVPEKGMIPWKGLLKPAEIQLMSSYILSLQGTLPEGVGKAPEGDKMNPNPTEEKDEKPSTDTTMSESASLLGK